MLAAGYRWRASLLREPVLVSCRAGDALLRGSRADLADPSSLTGPLGEMGFDVLNGILVRRIIDSSLSRRLRALLDSQRPGSF